MPFIEEIEHYPVKPVTIEREAFDMVIIEGVRYSGEYFRQFGHPDVNALYAVRKKGEIVFLETIHNLDEAKNFFDSPHPDPLPKGEGVEGDEHAI